MKDLFVPVLLASLFVESLTPNAVASNPRSLGDTNWLSMGTLYGANGPVHASVSDGAGNLYIGGSFTMVGNTRATNIAKWDGTKWSALGSGLNNQVRTLAIDYYRGGLLAGGDFTAAGTNTFNHIARWDDTNWSDVGGGVEGSVYALLVADGNLYVGGGFIKPSTSTINHLAGNNVLVWNGSFWESPDGGVDGPVFALAGYGDYVYAGGNFQHGAQSDLKNLARWDGTHWSRVGYGVSGPVLALTTIVDFVDPELSTLVIGGAFSSVQQSTLATYPANNIVGYSDFDDNFFRLDSGSSLNGAVNCLLVISVQDTNLDVIAGGEFTSANGTPANYIAKCRFSNIFLGFGTFGSWSAFGSGMNSDVFTLSEAGNRYYPDLYAGGTFSTANGTPANYFARWNSTNWSTLTSAGLNGGVSALVNVDTATATSVYAAGSFTAADGNPITTLARWNGTNWAAISGSSVNGWIATLVSTGGGFYAGGSSIGKFVEGLGWFPVTLGPGVNGPVSAMAASQVGDFYVYAGGSFTNAGSVIASNIVRLSSQGFSWSDVGGGVNGDVTCMTLVEDYLVPSSVLYVGGNFTTAGTNVVNRVAKWDGTNWSNLGAGFNNTVLALASLNGTIYAGGSFTSSGANPVSRVARWDGTNWTALGAGLNTVVTTLTVWGKDLYAGGNFIRSGTNVMNHLAKWDGTNWTSLGSGTDGAVNALLIGMDGYFYVGGNFTTAAGKVSPNITRAQIADPGRFLSIFDFYPFYGAHIVGLQFDGTPGVNYTLEYSPSLSSPHWQRTDTEINISSPATDEFGHGLGISFYNDVPIYDTNASKFYRSVWPAYH